MINEKSIEAIRGWFDRREDTIIDRDSTVGSKTCYLDRLLEKNNIIRIFCDFAFFFLEGNFVIFIHHASNAPSYIYIAKNIPTTLTTREVLSLPILFFSNNLSK